MNDTLRTLGAIAAVGLGALAFFAGAVSLGLAAAAPTSDDALYHLAVAGLGFVTLHVEYTYLV